MRLPRLTIALKVHEIAQELADDDAGLLEVVVVYRRVGHPIHTVSHGEVQHVQAMVLSAFHDLASREPGESLSESSEVSEAMIGPGDTHQ